MFEEKDPSAQSFSAVLEARLSRRAFLQGSAAATLVTMPWALSGCATTPTSTVGFQSVPISTVDAVVVPPTYNAEVLYRWGDPIGHPAGSPTFKSDASNTAAEQALQAGMHHDGMHFFSLPYGSSNATHGLLAMNHEYVDDGLLHADGVATWTPEKVAKSQAAHGVSVIEVELHEGKWTIVRPSRYARRITATTPTVLSGPAAGAEAMKTAVDPTGRNVLGTFANCANGYTPWGTYLTCEENWAFYFGKGGEGLSEDHVRNGVGRDTRQNWHAYDDRFDVSKHPHEANRFGWVVEIDPYMPEAQPIKHTALGRFAHEGATHVLARDGRLVVYMADDRAFECIYKFVSQHKVDTNDRLNNARALDEGVLYVARFDEDGNGVWLPLVYGQGPLTTQGGFRDQADVLIRTRAAAQALKATTMDRPEWIAVHPKTKEVYCTLTNNIERDAARRNAANPRTANAFGHIIRWREAEGDPAATNFKWDVFVLAGDPADSNPENRGNVMGDGFASPDGLWFDDAGRLWILTDFSTRTRDESVYGKFGNNMMLVADPGTKQVRRFLTGPRGCEVTGITSTPDGKTLFVNIQHPGENEIARNDHLKPMAFSSWPDGPTGGRPRAATVVIRKKDGGVIGT